MLGNYNYNAVIRRTVIAFGTLFNSIEIQKLDENNNRKKYVVPISYAPRQKFLSRVINNPNSNVKFSQISPAMSFEMTSIKYDGNRKVTPLQQYTKYENGKPINQYLPVPYNLGFELNIYSKINEDALQVLEQILPYFRPAFNLSIDYIDRMNENRDVPIVLDNISFSDDYEGNFEQRRVITYTLSFTAKTFIYGEIDDNVGNLIRKVIVDTYIGVGNTTNRSRRYIVEPDPLDADPDDDFGFRKTIIEP